MKSIVNNFAYNYDRISMTSDYKSEYASNIIFNGIRNINIKKENENNVFNKIKYYYLDRFNYNESYKHIPFNVISQKFIKKISGDYFLFRGIYWNNISNPKSISTGIPNSILMKSDLSFVILDNKLTIIKDRYNNPDRIKNFDLKPYLIKTKIDHIIKKINLNQ